MGFFNANSREPRRYHHKYMYVNERKEKLKKIEEKAKRELGMLPDETFNPEEIRGTFVKATKHLRRRQESGRKPMKTGVIIMLIIGLLLLWHFLWHMNIQF